MRPRALYVSPIVIGVLTLLLSAVTAGGECPSAGVLMESQVNLLHQLSFKLSKNIFPASIYITKSQFTRLPMYFVGGARCEAGQQRYGRGHLAVFVD